MGNHEFCTDCGASDYHLGSDCNPKEKAAYQAGLKAVADYATLHDSKAKKLVKKLKSQGIPAKIGAYGSIEISKWDL